jgi:hypothetical protein
MTSIFEVNENNRTKSSIKLDTQHDFIHIISKLFIDWAFNLSKVFSEKNILSTQNGYHCKESNSPLILSKKA